MTASASPAALLASDARGLLVLLVLLTFLPLPLPLLRRRSAVLVRRGVSVPRLMDMGTLSSISKASCRLGLLACASWLRSGWV
jgi:hypothetical protein